MLLPGWIAMHRMLRWVFGMGIVLMIGLVPFIHYRSTYDHGKRFREVTTGRVYRCGQLTTSGFREYLERFQIRTVINLQSEYPDPLLQPDFFDPLQPFTWSRSSIPESQVCQESGAKYVVLNFDLPPRSLADREKPKIADPFYQIFDDEASYPILLHCMAGLHRTGLLTGVYRMEYEHWPTADAVRELRANGFGDAACTTADDYVHAYMLHYRPRWQAVSAHE